MGDRCWVLGVVDVIELFAQHLHQFLVEKVALRDGQHTVLGQQFWIEASQLV